MPDQRFRKILLAVSGMSPQIITETVYALIQGKDWIPDEVRLITTEQGRQNAVLQLLEGERHFQRLLDDYLVDQPVEFTEQSINVIQDVGGHALPDLRTPEDNEAAANTICAEIRELTNDSSTELHVSLAGGRKTMGFYAGYALSLFGRPQDRLSHVLVSEDYENNRNFFYPTPRTRVIHDRDDQPLDASAARVWLAEIPFVRLRSGLPQSLLEGQHSFGETVELARKATEQARLILFPAACRYQLNGVSGKLTSVPIAILLWAAVRETPITPLVEGEKSAEYARELLRLVEQHNLPLHGRTELAWEKGDVTKSFLETHISKLNTTLAAQLGPELSRLCKLAIVQRNGYSGYALPENLEIAIQS
ncbi:MAG: CRISPR-associated ring nuclease Csm6 [Pseudohongiellaceae bacterium]